MAKMWAGVTAGVTDSIADDFNSSIRFDCKMYISPYAAALNNYKDR